MPSVYEAIVAHITGENELSPVPIVKKNQLNNLPIKLSPVQNRNERDRAIAVAQPYTTHFHF